MPRYVLLGSGVASIAAAEAIRSQDRSAGILILGDETHGFYSRPALAYYLTGELAEQNIRPFPDTYFHKLGIQIQHGRAVKIDPHAHLVSLHDGRSLFYDRLLIAVGAQAVKSAVTGAQLQGVFKLDNLEDARQIIQAARKARSAVVVGGGITALEIVEGLRARGLRVTYFLRGDRYWSNVLDETESRIIEHRLREEGVEIQYHTDLDEILEKGGRVAGVRTKDGRSFKCDMVGIAIGIRPRKELAEASGIQVDRGVLVNEYMQTSAADVYAAGDIAQVYDPLSGKSVLDSLWGPARDQGHAAGLNMAGKPTPYYKFVPFNVTRLANLTTTIIGTVGRGEDDDMLGIARGDSETWRQLPDSIAAQANFDVNRLRLMVAQKHIVGAIVMGDQTLSRPIHHMVANRVDISSIRQSLLEPGARLADILADFWAQQTKQHVIAAQ